MKVLVLFLLFVTIAAKGNPGTSEDYGYGNCKYRNGTIFELKCIGAARTATDEETRKVEDYEREWRYHNDVELPCFCSEQVCKGNSINVCRGNTGNNSGKNNNGERSNGDCMYKNGFISEMTCIIRPASDEEKKQVEDYKKDKKKGLPCFCAAEVCNGDTC